MIRKATLFVAAVLMACPWPMATAGATGTWSVVSSPNGYGPAEAGLTAVTCRTASACVAVGSVHVGGPGGEGTLIEAFDGTRWVRQPSPNAAGQLQSYLRAVASTSATSCLAVGSSYSSDGVVRRLAERWNGSKWLIEYMPAPTGAADQAELRDVTCWSASNCTIVGDFGAPLIEHWNGTLWSIASTANPPSDFGGGLESVSCTGPTTCRAVGYAFRSDGHYYTMAERWIGSQWSFDATPNPTGTVNDQLYDVSCTSAAQCAAVGSTSEGSLSERWNGSSWRLITAPHNELAALSCTSATNCIGVSPNGEERFNGSTWSPTSPTLNASNDGLTDVTCLSATSCTGVGGVAAYRWNGSRWSTLGNPEANGELYSSLSNVACARPSNCMAVGSATTRFGSTTLAEHWNGSAWSRSATAPPPGTVSTLASTACPGTSRCIAVGDYGADSAHFQPLAEIWNGKRWSRQTARKPSGAAQSTLLGVACPSTGVCTAVGWSGSATVHHTLAERWNGTSWSIQSGPSLPSPGTGELRAVTCSSASDCTAVGVGNGPLVEHWNGKTWAVQPVAKNGDVLNGVTCTASSNCFAVGVLTSGVGNPLVEHWNGKSWTVQASPAAAHKGHVLSAVSCLTASDCNTVGRSWDSEGPDLPFIEHWNGAAWSEVKQVPLPSNRDTGALTGAACIASRCTAVGYASSAQYSGNSTLVLRSS